MMNQRKAKKNYFDEYESPNITIVPTANICTPPSPKRIKLDTMPPNQSPEHTDISFLDDFNIDEIVACLNNCDNKQETKTNYEINQTAQCEPIETVLNKNDLIKPHEDFTNKDTNTVDNIEYSLKPVENKNLTNIRINGYEHVEKSSKSVFEIEKRSKKESNLNHTQIDVRYTERPSAMVTYKSVEYKKERKKRNAENDIDNCLIININIDLVVNGCRDVKKCLKSKSPTENDNIIKDEHTKSGKTESKTSKDTTGIEKRKKLEGELKINKDTTAIEEKKILEGEFKAIEDITSINENIKLEGEQTTGEVTTVDIMPINENIFFVGEPNITNDITSIQGNKRLEGKPYTTVNITFIKENNKLEDDTKATVDITSIQENKRLGDSKTTIDIASAEKIKKLEGEIKTIKDITCIKEKKKLDVDKPHIKPIKAKMSGDEKIFKTEVYSKSSIASAKTDVLELIKLEQQMYNLMHKKISILSTIHCGKYSKIFKCKDSIGVDYALKMINKNCHILHGTNKKIMLQNIQLDIPKKKLYCVYLYNSFPFNGHWYFLQEYFPKNLNQAMQESAKPFNINMTQDLASQLVGAVLLLRNNGIVHSDIKPNHILLNSTNTQLKLCGFDNAYYLKNNIISNIGALNYRPPEVILGCPAGFSIDVWSTALVLFEMFTGNKLFPGYSDSDMLYRQMKVLGSIPEDMLSISKFRDKYFHRNGFYYNKFQRSISINYFTGDNTIHDTVYHVYTKHWGTREQKEDQKKLDMFLNLLKKMLVLHPKRRLSIEFVCANPFIYELFSN